MGACCSTASAKGEPTKRAIHLLDVNTRKESPDVLPKARYMGISLTPDKKGIYYAKFEPTGPLVYLSPASARRFRRQADLWQVV